MYLAYHIVLVSCTNSSPLELDAIEVRIEDIVWGLVHTEDIPC